MSTPEEKAAALAALAAEAQPSGVALLELLDSRYPDDVWRALAARPITHRALVAVLPAFYLGKQRLCGACGGPLGFPATIAIVRADRPDPTFVLALGCCHACTAEGPAALRRKLLAYLGQIFVGMRLLEPTHAPPETLQ